MLLSSGYEAGSSTSVAVDGRSANRLVTAKIKLRSTFTPTSCTSTCRNLGGREGGRNGGIEEGKEKEGERKKREKVQGNYRNIHTTCTNNQ